MPAPERFETAQLKAERLRATHLPLLEDMHGDERVMATLGGVRTAAETQAFLDDNLAHWNQYGYGLWMLFDADDGSFVGRAGIRQVAVPDGEETEIAYALMAEYWGQGLATEVARRLVDIAFDDLGLETIVAFTWVTNAASEQIMRKLRLTYDRHFEHKGRPHIQYRMQRENWRGAE